MTFAGAPMAARAQVITCGQTVTGTIVNPSTVVTYRFGAEAGEAVVITGLSTDLDHLQELDLELRAPSGALLASAQGERDLPNTILPATGVYSIVVRGAGVTGPGTFNVNLQFSTGRCAAGPVACGDTLAVSFDAPGEQDAYWFEGAAGEAVVVAAGEHVLGSPTPRIDVYRPDGVRLGSNDPPVDWRTPSLVLPVTGRYTVVAHDDFFFDATGPYGLNVQFSTGRCGAALACGHTPGGTLDLPAAQDSFVFDANAGETVILTSIGTSGGVDARLEVFDPAGTPIGEGFSGATDPIHITASGRYTAVVHDFEFRQVGDYRLSLQYTTGRCAAPIACAQTIGSGIGLPAERDAFTFTADEDGWYQVHLDPTAAPLQGRLELFEPTGKLIGSADHFFPTYLFKAAAGPHTLLVFDEEGQGAGPYDVRLDCLALTSSAPIVTEGDGGSVNADFTVTLAAASTEPITVYYSTVDGTAQAGSDFTATSGAVAFPPGVTSRTVSVPVLGDLLDEPNERFDLSLAWTQPSTSYFSAGRPTATIVDDDGQDLRLLELYHGARFERDLAARPGPLAAEDLFVLEQRPYSSYEVVVDGTSGDLGRGDGLSLERLQPGLTGVIQTSSPVGAGSSRTLRWQYLSEFANPSETVRVRSASCGTDCGPDDVYRLRFYDTTMSIPRFNNAGGQLTVVILQNPGPLPVNANVFFWSAAGAPVAQRTLTIPPKGTATLSAATVPELEGRSGSITVTHDGGYGGLAGKAVALDPSTGFAFDSAMIPRPLR
jgi:hypothetical protein